MEKYYKYKLDISNETMDEICNKKVDFNLLPQQAFLADYIYDNNNVNGLLIFHQIGSGKTCTSISIAERLKTKMNIMIVLPASLEGNFRNTLRSDCVNAINRNYNLNSNYISNSDLELLKTLNVSDKKFIDIIQKSDRLIDKYYKIYSYHKFVKLVNQGLIDIHNTLLIIDEIQNMVSMSGIFYKSLYNIIHKTNSTLKLLLLTATPIFDNPNEISLTLNLLRPKIKLPPAEVFNHIFLYKNQGKYDVVNINQFKKLTMNLVSYYRGDSPISYPKMNLQLIRCNMSDFQYEAYVNVIKKEKKKKKPDDIFKLSNSFLLAPRIVSNIAFPNGKYRDEGFVSLKDNFNNIKTYSTKFYTLFNMVKMSTGPVFIYSAFLNTGGLQSLISYFEYNGYKNYIDHDIGINRYAIWSGDESMDIREKTKYLFNLENNKNGGKIKILFGSPSIKEGISLLRVEQVHILEPYWNLSRIKQIIGRAIRYCSHKDLPEDKRYVNVYIYLAVSLHTTNKLTDEYIWSIAKSKNKIISIFEHALKEGAIDCNIFYNINNIDNKQIICS